MSLSAERHVRPWPVKALVIWGVAGALWAAVFGDDSRTPGLVWLGFAILDGWAMWTGRRWAFSLTFAGTVLSALLLAVYVFTGSTGVDDANKIVWAATVAGTIYLLYHPLTKRFIGLDEGTSPQVLTGPPDRGGRLSQAIAISIFGLLAVGIPLMWAMSLIEGASLIVAVVACIGAGIAVLLLGLPARGEDVSASTTT